MNTRCYVCGGLLDGYDLGACAHCDRAPCLIGDPCGICSTMESLWWGSGPGSELYEQRQRKE